MIINFQRRYTKNDWAKLSQYAKDHNYPNLCEMIRRRALSALSSKNCLPCESMNVEKFDKNLKLQFEDNNAAKILCLAREMSISPSEFIARTVTDVILKETL